MIGIGRALLADPDWINKAAAGKAKEIRHCISGNECIDAVINGPIAICAVNAETGLEQTCIISSAKIKKM